MFKNFIFLFLIISHLFFQTFTFSNPQRMATDLEIIKNEFEIYYAPAEWKKKLFNWSLEAAIEHAKQEIREKPINLQQYQQILRDLFNSTQDLHVGVSFYSTEFAILPFLVQGVDQRYFVVWIDEEWKKMQGVPLEKGDEILAFDGRSAAEIIREIHRASYGFCDAESYHRLSEMLLTLREGNCINNVPQGTTEVLYKKPHQENPETCLVEWYYVPEEIENEFPGIKNPFRSTLAESPIFHRCRALPLFTRLKSYAKNYETQLLGGKKSLFPPLGEILWKSNSPEFEAYIYSLKGCKSVGYIRISDFMGGRHEVDQFRHLIAMMEASTHALIIDVMNNPGGFAFYTYALLSMLSDKPLMNLREKMAITQEEIFLCLEDMQLLEEVTTDHEAKGLIGEDICGFNVDKQFVNCVLKHARFIKDQFKKGKYLTDLYPLEGLEYIYPNPKTHYTKPLLVLVNSLSISCADLFPAILQENKRAKILGTRSAGAGGYVLAKKYSNRFGVADFTLTGSIISRANGDPLENLGVSPDFPYTFSAEDYTQNFSGFVEYLNRIMYYYK
ncbi:MAG: hypothetical protein BGO14_10950 [Chlamydiales bacterium 38-26]|nr:protease-like activity factor CPAF [Chlamydiales bacterium]OJV11468.1 MAG: hypothetical protein BGO14_10950 [Chlamydiales bacterium 38-26]